MDTISAAGLARALGTSVPRVARAARQLSIDAKQANGRYSFTPLQADRVRSALGMTSRAEGLSRSEVIVLAALRNAPFGLVSARSVARRSGLSPTASGRALESLRAKELVVRKSEMVAAGRAREMEIWRANRQHPLWPSLNPVLERVERPERPAPGAERVPGRLRHLFWNTAESQLDVDRAGAYIARRLLRTMDLQGLAWGAKAIGREDWEQAATARGLDPDVRRLAHNLAAAIAVSDRPRHVRASSDASGLNQQVESVVVAGVNVAGLQDLMAMKIKVMAERGEMRDYFDVKALDENGAISVEEGVELYMRRYGIDSSSDALPHLYRTMGDLSDVEADDLLPIDLSELQRWWSARQARVVQNSYRFG